MKGEKDKLFDVNDKPSIIWTTQYSYLILFFICWLTFGSYWVYDTPGAIFAPLQRWFKPAEYTENMNAAFYYAYNYPNIILSFFGGFIVDKLTGVRLGAAIFCGLVLLGQTIFSIAINWKIYWLAVVGRFIFGLGGESLTVAQNTYTARWFDGPQLTLAFGIVLSFSRIGSAVNFLTTPYFTKLGVPFAIWFGTEMCLISFCAVGFVALLDWYGEAAVKRRKERQGNDSEPEVSFKQILQFPLESWIIFLNCALFYISVLTFYTVASGTFQRVAGYDEDSATNLIAIPNVVGIFAAPIFGHVVDRFGRSVIWLGLAGVMMIMAHLALLALAKEWFTITPIAIMIWLGLAYSLFASNIWTSLPYVIKSNMLGTGYGTMTAIQNMFLASFTQLVPYLMGLYPDQKDVMSECIFITCASASVGLTILLYIKDKAKTGGVLNGNGIVRSAYKQRFNKPDYDNTSYMNVQYRNDFND